MAWLTVNEELARVFAEHPAEDITPAILFEVAEIFPHCLVFGKRWQDLSARGRPRSGHTKQKPPQL